MPPRSSVATLDAALIEEACKRSAVIWIDAGDGAERMAWHIWRDGAVYLVCGPGEQQLPGLAEARVAQVVVRSKDSGGRLLRWQAAVSRMEPASGTWSTITKELAAKRLNSPDAARQPARWAEDAAVLRLTPTGSVGQRPAYDKSRSTLPTDSLAAPPPGSDATTVGALPWVLTGRRGIFRRALRRMFGHKSQHHSQAHTRTARSRLR